MTENVKHVEEALGCFEAAEIEGWSDALLNGDIDRIRDLWQRRISYAIPVLEALRDQLQREAAGGGEAVVWQVRRTDGSPLAVWENCTRELYDATLHTGRYFGYENGPPCEVRALYTAPRPTGTEDDAWNVGMFDRWNDFAKQLGYTGICDALAHTPRTATPASAEPDCGTCDGTGREGGDGSPMPCSDCGGTGRIEARGGGEAEPIGQVLEVYHIVDDSYFARVEFIEPVKTGDLLYAAQTINPAGIYSSSIGSSHPTPAALDAEKVRATDEEIAEWVERHWLAINGSDARACFEDAQSVIAARATTGASE